MYVVLYTATVVLDSSVGMRGACPGEMVTYTCTVNQGAALDWIAQPFITGSTRIQFLSTTSTGRSIDCNDVLTVQCADVKFVATLTNLANPMIVLGTPVADMTSTLTINVTGSLNGTVVQCSTATQSGAPTANQHLLVAGNRF